MVERSKNTSSTGTLQRASIACQSCRLRKVKCDAQSGLSDGGCSPCRRAGQECLLDPSSDGRRSVSRKFVDQLQQRIETLEAINQRTASTPNESSNEIMELALGDASALACGLSTPRSSNIVDAELQSHAIDPALPRATDKCNQPQSPTRIIGGISQDNCRNESPSFYGATSHPHVVSPGEEPHTVSFDEIDEVDIDFDLNSPHLRDHLFQAFFKYQTLWVDIVNKESFFTHRKKGKDSRWYSKFLENAILACSTRLSTSKSIRNMGSKYCEWAKDGALMAMSEPTPANLQGFLLLSEYEVTQGNDRPGWMFCGVACRMLSDLGLHELASVVGEPKKASESTKESDLAYALLSACVVYEGVWTLYLGRPSSIPRSIMNIVISRCKAKRKSDSAWLNAWVGLCVPMAEISHLLNEQSAGDSDNFASLRKLFKQVEEWYDSLPPQLTYNESRLTNMEPAGYGLHTQYCKVQILIRQALRKSPNGKKRRYSQISSSSGPRTITDDSNAVIYKYALRTARLVVTYREAFGMEKIPSIMLDNAVVAATAMIGHIDKISDAREKQRQTAWLRQLMRSMELVQPHFPITGRMLDSLRQICGSGPLGRVVPIARRDSIDALVNELPAINPCLDTTSGSDQDQDNLISLANGTDFIWECFNTDISLGGFLSTGLDGSAFDLAPPEALISSLAQSVP